MVDWPDGAFLALIGCREPIIQAPMAGAGGVELCVAAMAGGALGSLPCALLSPDEVRRQVVAVRARAPGPLNLNFFCHSMAEAVDESAWRALLQPYYDEFAVAGPSGGTAKGAALRLPFDDEMCRVVEDLRPEVVSFHFGLPRDELLARVRQTGAIILSSATSLEEASWLARRGVDAIIAQGFEAGGHSARFLGADPAEAFGLFALLPQIADAVEVPVIAAGGIADGRGIAAAMVLGASAVQLGTAYLLAPEAEISPVHRRRLKERPTLFTNLLTGGLARGVRGRLIDELGPVRDEAPCYPFASMALAPVRAAAESLGDYGFSPLWGGQAGPLGTSLPAAELTRRLAADARAILSPLA